MASSKRTEGAATSSPAAAAGSTALPGAGRRNEGQSAPHQTTAVKSDIERLRFEATVNGRYHTARQGWYDRMHRLMMFVVVIGGTAAVAEAVGQGARYSWIIALIPTLAGTVDLVFDFAGKSAIHARLQERSYEIVADIESSADRSEAICKRGWSAIARICAQETKTMRVVHALAFNDTKEGYEVNVKDELLIVPLWARGVRHVWAADGLTIQSAKERRQAVSGLDVLQSHDLAPDRN